MTKPGWDQPLDLQWRCKLNDLNSILKQLTPVGKHLHDQLVPYTHFKPRTGGRLKRSWHLSKSDGISLDASGNGISIKNKLPYARAVSAGAPAQTISGKLMAWYQGGKVNVRRYVQQPARKANDFIERAVKQFWNVKHVSIRWRGGKGKPKAVAE